MGLSLGGDQGFSSSFFSAAAGASAARTVSLAARGADRDTERAWTALPEKADLRAPETVGATRAAHCAEMIAAIMLALLSRCRACWLGAGIARAATPIDAFQPAGERARSEGVGRVKSPLVSVTNQRRAFTVRFREPDSIRMIRFRENRTIRACWCWAPEAWRAARRMFPIPVRIRPSRPSRAAVEYSAARHTKCAPRPRVPRARRRRAPRGVRAARALALSGRPRLDARTPPAPSRDGTRARPLSVGVAPLSRRWPRPATGGVVTTGGGRRTGSSWTRSCAGCARRPRGAPPWAWTTAEGARASP